MVFTDNFGFMVSGLFTKSDSLDQFRTLKDITGSSEIIKVKGLTTDATVFNSGGMANFIQIGKGFTAPNAQDFEIENPFTNGGVEDNPIVAPNGGFVINVNKILYAVQINPTAGSGGIREVCYFLDMRNSVGVVKTFLMWRDVIPVVNFNAGQSITVESEVFV